MTDKFTKAKDAIAAWDKEQEAYPDHEADAAWWTAANAAIAAIREMKVCETVAWQYRFLLKDTNYWSGWTQVPNEESMLRIIASYKDSGFTAEGRALCTYPSPALPDAVREFIEKWIADGSLQTFEDRERFRKEAREYLERTP